MKRIVSFLTLISILAAITACGESGTSVSTTDGQTQTSDTSAEAQSQSEYVKPDVNYNLYELTNDDCNSNSIPTLDLTHSWWDAKSVEELFSADRHSSVHRHDNSRKVYPRRGLG